MGFWDYEVSSDDDEDNNVPAVLRAGNKQENVLIEPSHEMEARHGTRAQTGDPKKSLVDLANSDDEAEKVSHKRGAVDVDFDEIEAEVLAPKKRKKKSSAKGKSPAKGKGKSPAKSPGKCKSPGKDSCTKGSEQEQEADRQRRIEAIRKKVKDFAVEVDDDEDNDSEIECGDAPQAPATLRYREPAKPSRRPEDEEADIEAQLEKERQELLQSGKVTGAAAPQGEMLVLKVVCKHGHAQIRQPKDGDFVSLHDKFKKYAIQQNWATKSTKVHLTCDDEDVDIYNSTPDDFDLEDGMTIDVVLK